MRFLLSARWIGFFLAVVALAVVCVLMGDWQWHKREVRHESNERVEQHLAADPVPLDQVAPVGLKVTKDLEWTRVVAQGRYDPTSQVTVKFSTRDGRPGAEVVTPLLLDDGSAVLVDRGWVPTSNTAAAPSDVPAPPSGTVTVQGWLRPDSNAGADATTPVDGQVRSVSSTGGLELEPKPDLGGGPHFFYGLQWWFFAGLALAGFVWFARIEWLERRAGHGGPPSTRDGDREDVSATP
ncbi:SURF1 family protein [Aeromicrobium sp. REDSEA-S38_B2]|uniref:SURF1 family protein n=1 Tax=Aeromicrobium sp. REDSEA-S38_B2 TaxID=1811528 RepID=UPI000A656DC2|nr:SURF1 family protein [Aeromicrobium sp. REDSEA-S38_B2]